MGYVNLAQVKWKPCPLHGYCGKDCMKCDLPTATKGQLEELAANVIEIPEGATNKDIISSVLPEGAELSVDRNGYVHIRGMKGEDLNAPYDTKISSDNECIGIINKSFETTLANSFFRR